jgi:hypothetical protein
MLRKRRFTTEDTEGTEVGMRKEKGGKPNYLDDWTGLFLSKVFSARSVSSVLKSFCGREFKLAVLGGVRIIVRVSCDTHHNL